MKAAVFDPFSGASGDMITSSLIDAGADSDAVRDAMEASGNVEVEIREAVRRGIRATVVSVTVKKEVTRSYPQLLEYIESIGLPRDIEASAAAIFDLMAEAEAHVHGIDKNELHFHELGQADAIADVVGACTAFRALGLHRRRIFCTPISVGRGFVETAHGKLPVPAPATLEILRSSGLLFKGGPFDFEMLTPTGAAILSHFVAESGDFPQMRIEKTGYGAGMMDFPAPNVLRLVLGETDDALISDRIEMLETNVDNVTGEVLGNLIDELMEAGARDVSVLPAVMKKGRSGHVVRVVVKPEDSSAIARKMIEETGSLGIRVHPVRHRLIAQREAHTVEVAIAGVRHAISVKVARDLNGDILSVAPEFEDCRKVSKASGLPVREVMRRAQEAAWSSLSEE